MLKMMRTGNRAAIRQQYGEFAQQIGLSKEVSSQLFDLLTDQQLAGSSDAPDLRNEADVRRYFEEKQRANEAAIADLIGADKAAQLKAYQESMPARMQFEMLAQQLDGSDAPLSAEQRTQTARPLRRGAQSRSAAEPRYRHGSRVPLMHTVPGVMTSTSASAPGPARS